MNDKRVREAIEYQYDIMKDYRWFQRMFVRLVIFFTFEDFALTRVDESHPMILPEDILWAIQTLSVDIKIEIMKSKPFGLLGLSQVFPIWKSDY